MASRYWVGGTGTWGDTARWSTTSGGAGGASVPTNADDVFFDANSGGGTVTIGGTAKTLDLRGFTGNFAGGTSIFYLGSGSSYLTSTVGGLTGVTFQGSSTTLYGGGATVANLSGNITVASDLTTSFIGYNATLGAFSISLTVNSGVTLTAGRVYGLGQNISFSGAGKLRLTGVASQPIVYFSQTFGSSTLSVDCLVELVGVSATEILDLRDGVYTYGTSGEFRFVRPASVYTITAWATSAPATDALPTIHLYPETSGYVVLKFDNSYTTYVKDLKSTVGSSGQQNIFEGSSGVAAVVTSVASTSFNNVNVKNLNVSGQAVSGTRVGDLGGNTGITFSATSNIYRIATGAYDATSAWSTVSGGSANASLPLPQDVAVFDGNTPAGTITISGNINYYSGAYLAGFSASAYTGTISFSSSASTASDQAVFGSSTTLSMSSNTLTSYSTSAVQVQCPNGGLRLSCGSASLTSASDLTLTATGAATTNNYAHTLNLTLNGTATADFGTSAITLRGLSAATGATLTAASATFATSGSVTINLNGKTLPNLTVSSATAFTTNATITSLTHSAGDISVTAAVTLTATAYTSPAPSATPPSLKCTTVGSTFTFNTSGAKVLQNLNLQGVDVPGTTYWNALNCINGGYNDAYILFNNNAGAIALF